MTGDGRPRDPMLPGWDAAAGDDDGASASAEPWARWLRPAPAARVRSVAEVARAIRNAVRADDDLRDLWIEGELSRVTISTAGHAYFTLKDARAALACVWFRDERLRSPFQPESGLAVVARGRIDVFEQQGAVQFYVESMQPAGQGNLALRFEQLKVKLAAEGLFDSARKRPLPARPGVVAVVSSPTGAVWRDVRTVISRRWPLARLLLVPCQVQGEGAAASIVVALARLEAYSAALAADGRADEAPAVTILARGGGSPEDLAAFNEERVVRAVAAHTLPIVVGVGHEVDVTLVDFAADVRAATPSAAAELVVPDRVEVLSGIRATGRRGASQARRRIGDARRALDAEGRVLARFEPAAQLAANRERVGLLLDRATAAVSRRLEARAAALTGTRARPAAEVARRLAAARSGLASASASLSVLGPQATLERGYALVRRSSDGALVRDPSAAPAGTGLVIALAAGEIAALSGGTTGEA